MTPEQMRVSALQTPILGGFLVRVGVGALALWTSFPLAAESALDSRARGSSWWFDNGYVSTLGALYRVFGEHLIFATILNAAFGTAAAVLIYRAANEVFGREIARRVLWLAMFLPPFVLFTASNLKEGSTVFWLALSVWALASWKSHARLSLLIALLAVAAAYWWRGPFWAGAVAVPLAAIPTPRVWLPLGLIIVGSFAFLAFHHYGGRLGNEQFAARFAPPGSCVRAFAVQPRTEAATWLERHGLSGRALTIANTRAVFSPSPLGFAFGPDWKHLIDALVMLTWYAVVPLAAVAFVRHARGDRLLLVLGLMAMGLVAVIASGTGLGTTLVRHRVMIFVPLMVLAGGAWKGERVPGEAVLTRLWWVGVGVFSAVYLAVRLASVDGEPIC